MLNRSSAPEFKKVSDIQFIQPTLRNLQNCIPVYTIDAGDQDLVRIEFIFENVNWKAEKALRGIMANGLINSGTSSLSSQEIAEKVDYYGAFLQTEYSSEQASVSLYTLTKHLAAVLPIVKSILNDSVFPQEELAIYVQNHQQKLQVSLQKKDFVARKTFANILFGDTPYGAEIMPEDYGKITRDELLAYYRAAYQPQNCTIVIAGKFTDSDFLLLDKQFGSPWNHAEAYTLNSFEFSAVEPQDRYIEMPDAVQSAIRLGNLSVNRKHADFAAVQVMNCLFGGYFGSRLMANIREDKGYTYGIGSAVVSLNQGGYFFIAAEVGADVCTAAMNEIKFEVERLRSEEVSEGELELVKNYMLGSLLGSLENAFSHADKFKNIHFSGQGYGYYDNYIQTVNEMTTKRLHQIVLQYLDWSKMTKVIVGKK